MRQAVGEGLHKYFRILPRVFTSGYVNTRRPVSISLYKIRLRNVL